MEVIRRADLDFLLFDWLDVESLAKLPRFLGQTVEDYRAFLDLGERIAREKFLPAYKVSDREEPRLVEDGRVIVQADIAEAVRAFLAASLHLATVNSGRGGLQFPHTVATAVTANVMAANIAASAFSMLSTGNARVLTNLGTPAQIEAFAVPSVCRRGLGRHVSLRAGHRFFARRHCDAGRPRRGRRSRTPLSLSGAILA